MRQKKVIFQCSAILLRDWRGITIDQEIKIFSLEVWMLKRTLVQKGSVTKQQNG